MAILRVIITSLCQSHKGRLLLEAKKSSMNRYFKTTEMINLEHLFVRHAMKGVLRADYISMFRDSVTPNMVENYYADVDFIQSDAF